MTLQWSSIQPTEEGFYWAAPKDSRRFGVVYLRDGQCYPGGISSFMGSPISVRADQFDLWSWPVEVPPAPVRAAPVVPADTQPAKDETDVPPTAKA